MVTLDACLALVGGYAALIWQILSVLLSWYQDFSYTNTLTMQLYTADKRSAETRQSSDDEKQSPVTEAETAILNRMPHDYCIFRRTTSRLLRYFCCCLRGRPYYDKMTKNDEMNTEIEDGLAANMDIIDILRWFRIFKLVSILTLRKNQAQLVKYFRDYSLQENSSCGRKIESSVSEHAKELELADLMKDFKPDENYTDKVLLFMLTGQNLDNVMKDWLDGCPDAGQDGDGTDYGGDPNPGGSSVSPMNFGINRDTAFTDKEPFL